MDLMLPDMDGIDVCREIRARPVIPILTLTARGDAMDHVIRTGRTRSWEKSGREALRTQ